MPHGLAVAVGVGVASPGGGVVATAGDAVAVGDAVAAAGFAEGAGSAVAAGVAVAVGDAVGDGDGVAGPPWSVQVGGTQLRGKPATVGAPVVRSALASSTVTLPPEGSSARSSASTPDVWGADMLVPVLDDRPPLKLTLRIEWPAVAGRSGQSAQKGEHVEAKGEREWHTGSKGG